MDGHLLSNLLMAGTAGLFVCLTLFFGLTLLFAPDLIARLWSKTSKALSLALVFGYAVIAMAAVTQIDLVSQVKNILASANGGTGIAYFLAAGPTALRTFTFPDASATILTSNSAVTAAQGGTGTSTNTAHGVLLGEGTSAVVATSAGGTGTCFMGNTSADPTFQSCPSAPNDYQEVPSGSINGSNVTFTLAHTPGSATNVNCFLNGMQQRQGAGLDYTISSAIITYLTAPPTGYTLNCLYF